ARYAAPQFVETLRAGDEFPQQNHRPSRAENFRRHRDRTKLIVGAFSHRRSPGRPQVNLRQPYRFRWPRLVQFLYRADSVGELATREAAWNSVVTQRRRSSAPGTHHEKEWQS